MAEILFHGAAGEVTGSMHMLNVGGRWVALDCGLFQGRRAESEEKNRTWPIPPREIAAVVVSHAHIDHTGRLPKLMKDGFDGPIYTTHATRDLAAIMLPDSAHIQEEDVVYLNKKRQRKNLPPIEPLYEYHDALAAIRAMNSTSYDHWFSVVPGLRACYQEAGHMLGSAGIRLALGDDGSHASQLYFTGDVGRPNAPILRDPAGFPPCDTMICEATYGGRVNEEVADAKEQMRAVIQRTYARGGKVIIPAFSVGRTQTIVYFMHEQMISGDLPRFPIFVDSPLAVNATEVFKMHPDCYDAEARAFHKVTGDILGHSAVTYVRDVDASKALHGRRNPCTIIAASGMCEAGRIRHHLKNNLGDARNTILLPGFQAEHTLGRRLVDGVKEVSIFGESFTVRAEVVQIHGFSGHADQRDLLHMFQAMPKLPRHVYLVHAEAEQAEPLAGKLREVGVPNVTIATRGMKGSVPSV